MEIKNLKSKSSETLKKLVSKGLSEKYEDRFSDQLSKFYYRNDRISEGLLCDEIYNFVDKTQSPTKNEIVVKNILNCRKCKGYESFKNTFKSSLVCGSFWCDGCRNFYSLNNFYKIKNILDLKFGTQQRNYSNDDLYHITSIVGLSEFDSESVKKLITKDNLRWRKIRYRLNQFNIEKEGWIEGVYEFELVNWRYLFESNGSEYKKLQIKQLLEKFKVKGDVLVFVHLHSLGCFENKDDLDFVFGKEYFINNKPLIKTDSKTGNYIQKLHKNNSLDQNIRKITSYPFKSVYRFKHTYLGSDFKNGEYLSNEELGRLILLYEDLKGRGGRKLFRSVENKKLFNWKRKKNEKLTIKDFKKFGYGKLDFLNRVIDSKKNSQKIDGVKSKIVGVDDIRDDFMDLSSLEFWEDFETNYKLEKEKLQKKVITKKLFKKKLVKK